MTDHHLHDPFSLHLQTAAYNPFYQQRNCLFDPNPVLDIFTEARAINLVDCTGDNEANFIYKRIQALLPAHTISLLKPTPRTLDEFDLDSFEVRFSSSAAEPASSVSSPHPEEEMSVACQPGTNLWIFFVPYKIDLMHNLDLLWNFPSEGWRIHFLIHSLSQLVEQIYLLDNEYRLFHFRQALYFGELQEKNGARCSIACAKLTKEEIQTFYEIGCWELPENGLVVDVGTWMGGSAVCFGKSCQKLMNGSKVITIDHKQYGGLHENLKRAGVTDYVTPIVGDVFQVFDNSQPQITEVDILCDDIYFSDYNQLSNLLYLYDSRLKQGGILIIQNYRYFGLWQRAVFELLLNTGKYELISIVATSALLRKIL